ncbi:MAG: hypothetical protein JEZ03_05400 [Bacteroidales bacterium]|nr:hypothetical protein [Bacteroidales bacterium]
MMNIKKRISTFIIILICIFSLYSCNKDLKCYDSEDKVYIANINFMYFVKGEISDTILPELSIYNSLIGDSLYKNMTLSSISIPLNPNDNQCKFMITTSLNRDSILLKYESEITQESYECGFNTIYYIDNISFGSGFIDSITIINDTINEEKRDNFNIWIRRRIH